MQTLWNLIVLGGMVTLALIAFNFASTAVIVAAALILDLFKKN